MWHVFFCCACSEGNATSASCLQCTCTGKSHQQPEQSTALQVLLVHGLVGLQTHRATHKPISQAPPWDEFQIIEESWAGVRVELERMLATAVEYASRWPDADTTYSPSQLSHMACST